MTIADGERCVPSQRRNMLTASSCMKKKMAGYRASSPFSLSSDSGCEYERPSKEIKISDGRFGLEKLNTSVPVASLNNMTIGHSEHDHFDRLFVGPNGRPIAITITQEKGKFNTSLVPIASHIADAKKCVDTGALVVEHVDKGSRELWEDLEYEMHMCKELVEEYVELETYGIPFHKIGNFLLEVRLEVYTGKISAECGVTKFFDHMRSLLDVHTAVARGKEEFRRFRVDVLEDALSAMDTVEYETYKCGHYGVSQNSKQLGKGIARKNSNLWSYGSSEYSSSDDSAMSLAEKVAVTFHGDVCIGYVNGPEEFGDADESTTTSDDVESLSDKSSCTTESGNAVNPKRCDAYKDAKIRDELKTFSKLMKRYNLGLSLLPDLLKQKTLAIVSENRSVIGNGGYTSKQAFQDLQRKVGKLRPNAELRKLFLEATLAADLDG